GLVRAALLGDPELMLPVVVVRAVVVHDDEHRQFEVGRGPQRPGIEKEIAVWLDVDDELPIAAVRKRDADRDPYLRRRAEAPAGPPRRRVDVPELPGPVLEVVRGEDPVLAFDRVPHLARKASGLEG